MIDISTSSDGSLERRDTGSGTDKNSTWKTKQCNGEEDGREENTSIPIGVFPTPMTIAEQRLTKWFDENPNKRAVHECREYPLQILLSLGTHKNRLSDEEEGREERQENATREDDTGRITEIPRTRVGEKKHDSKSSGIFQGDARGKTSAEEATERL